MASLYPSIPSAPPEDPPSYETAAHADALPPSYDELYGEFRQVDSPRGFARFIDRALTTISRTVTATIVFAILNIVPIGMIVVGSINKEKCAVQPLIPKWLIVSGSFYLATALISGYGKFHENKYGTKAHFCLRLFGGILNVFLAVWFILGSIWVYWVKSKVVNDPDSPNYCDEFTYTFSFVFITLSWVFVAISMFLCCCCCCFICCRRSRHERMAPA